MSNEPTNVRPGDEGYWELTVTDAWRYEGDWIANGCWVERAYLPDPEGKLTERTAMRRLKGFLGRSGERWDDIGAGMYKVRNCAIVAWLEYV